MHMSLWYSFVSGLSLSSVVSFSLSLSCTLPRTTGRDLDVLTSFHLAQENKLSFAVIFAWERSTVPERDNGRTVTPGHADNVCSDDDSTAESNRSTYRAAEDGALG